MKAPVIFGEVLFDCFPDGKRVLGGAPFNVAWHCAAFGLRPLFISRIGEDAMGREIETAMREWGMDTTGVQHDGAHPTGVVKVSFNQGEPAYDIVEGSAWDYIDTDALPEHLSCGALYHGSLALRSATSARALASLRTRCTGPRFVDINLRAPWWAQAALRGLIDKADWLKLNEDELTELLPGETSTGTRIERLMKEAGLQGLILTQGARGAMAVGADGQGQHVAPRDALKVVDTVGAGDAFSAVALLAQYHGWSLRDLLERAQEFAAAVVGLRGATTRERSFYRPFIEAWGLENTRR